MELVAPPDLVASEPAVVRGSTLLPVVTSTPLSVGFLTPKVSVESVLGVESFVVLPDSTPSVDDAGVLTEDVFVVSAAGSSVPSGCCAGVSAALASAPDPAEGVVLAGVLTAVLPVVSVTVVAPAEGTPATSGCATLTAA